MCRKNGNKDVKDKITSRYFYMKKMTTKTNTQKSVLSCFDFCSGIGSAHQAFRQLGCKISGYSEINSKAEGTCKLFCGNKYKNYGI